MKRYIKYFGVFLTLMLCLVFVPSEASAADTSDTCGADLTWSVSNGTLTISGSGVMTNYTHVRDNPAPWYGSRDDITRIVIGSGVTSVGDYAFQYMDNVTSVTLPDTLTRIGSNAFAYCDVLTGIDLPDSLVAIGDFAFYDCGGLTAVAIPASVTSMGNGVFAGCPNLTTAGPVGGDYDIQFSWSDAIPDYAFYGCSALTEITLPESVTAIGSYAFRDCSKLTGIILPESITEIGSYAFQNCPALTEIILPESVTEINYGAFFGCTNLVSVAIPAAVTVIYSDTFYKCSNLLSVDIPVSVTKIALRAFGDCTNLSTVFYGGTQEQWEKIDINSYGNDTLLNARLSLLYLTQQPESVSVPAGKKVTFSVRAAGDARSYQWQHSTNGGKTWTNNGSTGSKTNTLTLNSSLVTLSRSGMRFRCVVTDADGNQLHSNPAVMTVLAPITIKSQPKNVVTPSGKPVSFSVAAVGDDLTYQWQHYYGGKWSNNGSTGSTTSTLTLNSSLVTPSRSGMQFRCVITDANGNQLTSDPATMTVQSSLSIKTQPKSVTTYAGKGVSFAFEAAGEGLKYQWQHSTNSGKTWSNNGSTGSTTNTLQLNNSLITLGRSGMQFRCVVTDKHGSQLFSQPATLTVVPSAAVTGQTLGVTANPGVPVHFSVAASGKDLTYQWQHSTNGGKTWSNNGSTGCKTPTLTLNSSLVTLSRNGMQFRCIVTDAFGNKAYSNAAVMTVKA